MLDRTRIDVPPIQETVAKASPSGPTYGFIASSAECSFT